MLIRKQVTIWVLELCAQALLLGVILSVVAVLSASDFKLQDAGLVLLMPVLIAPMILLTFLTSWYAVTTLLLRLFWSDNKSCSPSIVASVLFLIHFCIASFLMSNGFPAPVIYIGLPSGIVLAYFTTWLGTRELRRWSVQHPSGPALDAKSLP